MAQNIAHLQRVKGGVFQEVERLSLIFLIAGWLTRRSSRRRFRRLARACTRRRSTALRGAAEAYRWQHGAML